LAASACHDAEVTLLPGAEPFAHDGDLASPEGRIGIVVSHGFTGCPQSMRPWAEVLAGAGFTVRLPRLPGHGTTWQDLQATRWPDWYGELDRSYTELAGRCERVFAVGLSMGGGLVFKLAEDHPEVAGVVAVNPSLGSRDKRLLALPVVKHLVPTFPGVADDIKKEGGHEVGYDRAPLKAVDSLRALWGVVAPALATIGCPVLTYRSRVDHVVDSLSGELLTKALGTTGRYTEVILENSYHVATLDNDAPLIEQGSLAFVREHAGLGATA
jgi:carboxylesterase